MTDLAILEFVTTHDSFDPHQKYFTIALNRFNKQLDWLWTAEGGTREHSISYQEFNLIVLLDFLDLKERASHSYFCKTRSKVNNILKKSQTLLTFSLQENKRFFPIGDSFNTEPKHYIYKRLEDKKILSLNLKKTLGNEEKKDGLLFMEKSGFFIYKKNNLHLCQTACWFSDVHKQEDDLSFCLNLNKKPIFIDPGYSDKFGALCQKTTNRRVYHNTVCSEDEFFLRNKKSLLNKVKDKIEKKLNLKISQKRTCFIHLEKKFLGWIISSKTKRSDIGCHKRILEYLEKEKTLKIEDSVSVSNLVYQTFHLNPELDWKTKEKNHIIIKDKKKNKRYHLYCKQKEVSIKIKKADMWFERNQKQSSQIISFQFRKKVTTFFWEE